MVALAHLLDTGGGARRGSRRLGVEHGLEVERSRAEKQHPWESGGDAGVGQAQKHRRWVSTDLGDGMECSGGGWEGMMGQAPRI